MITIINYKAGNSESVKNALKKLGYAVTISAEIGTLEKSEVLILPGVGSAKATLDSLKEKNLLPFLNDWVQKRRKPFLGICVGYQIIFEHSQEEDTPGLGWIKGKVHRFDSQKVKVPQIGWNEVIFEKHPRVTPFKEGLPGKAYFYYVNSYYATPEDESLVLARSHYANSFCGFLKRENLVATQFHLEKSGAVGLKLMRNIIEDFLN